MKLTDAIVKRHLERGGKIKLSKVDWAYAKVVGGQLFWCDKRTDDCVCCVEAFIDIISSEWHMMFEPPVITEDKLMGFQKET